MRARSLLPLALLPWLAACPAPPPLRDAAASLDASPSDAGDAAPVDARPPRDDAGLGPVAPMRDPEPLPVPTWMFTTVENPAAGDPVFAAIENGTFRFPAEGGSAHGAFWEGIEPDEDGGVGTVFRGVGYVAANVTVPAGRRVFARADTVLAVWTNGAQQPGDVYASGRMRVPLVVRPEGGENLVVARVLGGRGAARMQLFQTPDELVINAADATVPDLVVGDMGEQWLGVAVLNLTGAPALDVAARVEASADWEATEVRYPSLAGGAVTQLAFRLAPRRAWAAAGQRVTVAVRVESPSLDWTYRRELTLETVAAGTTFRRTFRSAVDRSAQYYGVVPPSSFDPARQYGLVLALHGASVEGIGHARAYSARDWTYVIAPTNRRPFGFDWEVWGRLDALEVLDHATSSYRIDPTRVYLTGHSMGGHGTWNIGAHVPGRFATIGPSAGWSSFYTYQGTRRPTGAFARSQAASDTNAYLSNLARRGAYVIHGTADNNVPVRESRALVPALREFTMDVTYHEEPGAGHWWDGMRAPGADCVDWLPLFEFMRAHTLDPTETDFTFRTPSSWVNGRHSFVTVLSENDAYMDAQVTSARAGDAVTLTTQNVRAMRIDGAALRARGVARLAIDGRAPVDVANGPMVVGPETGKRPGVHGPFDEVLMRPFCFAYPDDGPVAYQRYASFLLSTWSLIGNGHGCAMPVSRVTAELRRDWNIVYLGVAPSGVHAMGALPFSWDRGAITVGDARHEGAALAMVFPDDGGRLAGVVTATAGAEHLMFRLQPFTSGFVMPDYLVFTAQGARAAGFFNPDWSFTAGR